MKTLPSHIHQFMISRRALGIYNAKSQRVVTPRLYALSDHHGGRPLASLNRRAIEAWLGTLGHLAVNSRAAYLCSVRQFTRWLATEGHLPADPCAAIPAVKRVQATPRAQPPDAIALVLAACSDDRDRAIIWLMVGLGLRRMEVAGLRWEDYDERSGLLVVRVSKNARDRVLPVVDEVASALARVRGRGTTGPIIRSAVDAMLPVSPEWVGTLAGRAMRRAGIKATAYDGVSGHALRHTAASDVLDHCGDLRVVQQMLGHANLSTTSIYLRRATAGQLRAAMAGRPYGQAAA